MVNYDKVKSDVKQASQDLRELKEIFRESGQPRLQSRHYLDRRCLKELATALCCIRARARGKLHLKNKTEEDHQKLIDVYRKYYLVAKAG